MNKPKCDNQFRRHRWLDNRTCERCGKTRNEKAGDKMFRSVEKHEPQSCPTGVENE